MTHTTWQDDLVEAKVVSANEMKSSIEESKRRVSQIKEL